MKNRSNYLPSQAELNDLAGYAGGNQGKQYEGMFGSGFAGQGLVGLKYTFEITNQGSLAVDQSIALFPGYYDAVADIKDPNGNAVTAILGEGSIIATADKEVVGKGITRSLKDFMAFHKHVPVVYREMRINTDNSEQLDEQIYVKNLSPYSNLETQSFTPATEKDPDANNDKAVVIDLFKVLKSGLAFDNQTQITFVLKAARKVTITLTADNMLNIPGINVAANQARRAS